MATRRINFRSFPPEYAGEGWAHNEERFRAAVELSFALADQNFDSITQALEAVAGAGDYFYTVTDDAGDGSVVGDVAATDYTGQEHSEGGCAVNPEGVVVYYRHKGAIYFWTGPRPSSVGVCTGAYVPVADDLTPFGGVVQWDDIQGKPSNPTIEEHIADTDNPHEVTFVQLPETPAVFEDGKFARSSATDIFYGDVNWSEVVGKPSSPTIEEHIADMSNPHETTFIKLLDTPASYTAGKFVRSSGTDILYGDVNWSEIIGKPSSPTIEEHIGDTGNPHQVQYLQLIDTTDTDFVGKEGFVPFVRGTDLTLEVMNESKVTDLDRIRWRNTWIQQEYLKNDQVRDGDWLCTANKTTTDRAAPQLEGDPQWDLPDAPAWVTKSYTGSVTFRREWDVSVANELIEYQVLAAEVTADTRYTIYLYSYPTGQPELAVLEQQADPSLVEGQWTTVAIPRSIVTSGVTFGIAVETLNSGSDTQPGGTPADWNRQANSNNGSPTSGGWNRSNNETTFRINETDADGNVIDFVGAISGTTFQIVSTVDAAQSVTYIATSSETLSGGVYSWSISQESVGTGGEPPVGTRCLVTITVPVPSATKYVELLNGNPLANSRGILEFDGVPQTGVENNAYGVRVLYDAYILSPDWDINGFVGLGSGGSGGGDTGGGVTDFLQLTDTPTTYAGSAGMLATVKADETGLEFLPEGNFVEITGDVMTGPLTTPRDGHIVQNNGTVTPHNFGILMQHTGTATNYSGIRRKTDGTIEFYVAGTDFDAGTESAYIPPISETLLAGGSEAIVTKGKADARYLIRSGQSSGGQSADTSLTVTDGTNSITVYGKEISLPNKEPSDLSLVDGTIGFDSSRGLLAYRTQIIGDAAGAGVYTVLDASNISGAGGIVISNNTPDDGGTSPVTFTFDPASSSLDSLYLQLAGGSTVAATGGASIFAENALLVQNGNTATNKAITFQQTVPDDANDKSSIRLTGNGNFSLYVGPDHTSGTISATLSTVAAGLGNASTIVTREKGDARYLQLSGGEISGTLALTNGTNTSNFSQTMRSTGASDGSFVGMRARNTGEFSFYTAPAGVSAEAARINHAGTTVSHAREIITREKGDARYVKIAAAVYASAIVTANSGVPVFAANKGFAAVSADTGVLNREFFQLDFAAPLAGVNFHVSVMPIAATVAGANRAEPIVVNKVDGSGFGILFMDQGNVASLDYDFTVIVTVL